MVICHSYVIARGYRGVDLWWLDQVGPFLGDGGEWWTLTNEDGCLGLNGEERCWVQVVFRSLGKVVDFATAPSFCWRRYPQKDWAQRVSEHSNVCQTWNTSGKVYSSKSIWASSICFELHQKDVLFFLSHRPDWYLVSIQYCQTWPSSSLYTVCVSPFP